MDRGKHGCVKTFVKNKGRTTINFTIINMGEDLCVSIYGGERPHLGASALAQCRPSLADSRKASASVSVLSLLGHKEDKIASSIAERLSSSLKTNVIVSCGIHNDNITLDEIQTICCMTNEWCAEFLKANV